ncbi:hypothetical protein [Pantoea sp. SO10]|uniref:hypothetical protein n=1 Tax=Pantoea sp. SO10 TaxID=2575375 RepID=UPI0010C9EF74|nr:hypothetical protein [Pantoea sp. SO10]QCP62385.1 hypothetical protein FCN45_23570 [Pantoea sp. SO10]
MIIISEVINNNAGVKITSDSLNGTIYTFDRERLNDFKQSECLATDTFCYILYNDYYDRNKENCSLYIGQTDKGLTRIETHSRDRIGWNKAVIISYAQPSIDIICRLEGDLIQLALKSLKYHTRNVKSENKGYICSCQEENYRLFLTTLKLTLEAINIDILKVDLDGAFHHKNQPNLRAKIIKDTPPYEIEIIKGSYAQKNRLASLSSIFDRNNIKTEIRHESITGNINYTTDVIYYIFEESIIITSQAQESYAFVQFESINKVSLSSKLKQ